MLLTTDTLCTTPQGPEATVCSAAGPAGEDSVSLNDDSLAGASVLQKDPAPSPSPPAPRALAGALPAGPLAAAGHGPADAPQLQPPASEEERLELVAALWQAQPGERFGAVTG